MDGVKKVGVVEDMEGGSEGEMVKNEGRRGRGREGGEGGDEGVREKWKK